jgi:hypothetical protein
MDFLLGRTNACGERSSDARTISNGKPEAALSTFLCVLFSSRRLQEGVGLRGAGILFSSAETCNLQSED